MTSDATASLERTAALYGVEAAWVDIEGRRRIAPPEVVFRALAALGAPVEGAGDLEDAARVRRLEIWRRVVPPVRVATPGERPSVPLRLPAARARGPLRWRVTLEGGGVRSGEVRVDALGLAGGSSVEGRRYEIRRLELPPDLPPGRHGLSLRHGARETRSHVVVSPGRCHRSGRLDRAWGVFHPLYGLRDPGEGAGAGVGDLSTLREAARWTARRGGRLFGTTPLLAGFDEPPVDPSPYAPASRLFWDDRFLDLASVPGFEAARAAGELRDWEALAARRDAPFVPWDELSRARATALVALARRFFEAGGDRERDFQAYLRERPDAGDFARFRAAGAAYGRDWRRWPAPARDGAPDAAALDPAVVRRHLFAQWRAARQLAPPTEADGPAGLYLDLPLGSHPDGYDAWRHRPLFVEGVSAGAPPDDFFRGGQDWGLPPLHPRRLREDGYRYVTAVLGHAMRPASMIRIDHVMQLHRVFWVPRGARPADGLYVRYPAEELAAVIALASDRHECEVAGEDLGTVPEVVRELMDAVGMRRSTVLGFSLDRAAGDAAGDPAAAAPGSVAMIGTHDMVPLRGLREGRDLDERTALGLLEASEGARLRERRRTAFDALDARFGVEASAAGAPDPLLAPLLAALGGGAAGVVLATLDDLVGAADPQNVPGTTDERPNWRRRLGAPLDALGPGVDRLLAALDAARDGEGEE